ncbi:MAG: MFS transporter [Acidimicrobiia bacterium]
MAQPGIRFLRHFFPPERLSHLDVRLLALMAVIAFTQGYAGSLLTHTLPFARTSLALSEGQMSGVFAVVRAAAFAGLALSLYGDRRGRRRPLLAAFVLLPAANLATALVPGVPAFIILQSLARVGTIAVGALAIVVLAEEISPSVRSYAIGVYVLVGAMGTGFSLILLPIVDAGPEAWRILFGLSSMPLVAFPLLVVVLRESRLFTPMGARPPLAAALRGGHARHFWPMAALTMLVAAFSGPAINFALERLVDDLGWHTGDARNLLIVTSGLGTAGFLVGGRIADLIGRRPTEATALILGGLGGLGFYFFDSGYVMGPAIFLATLGATAFAPAFAAHRSELFPTDLRATATAWLNNAGILGGLVGFGVGFFAIDAWGLSNTVGALALSVLAAAALVVLLPETRGMDLSRAGAGSAAADTPGPP